MSNLTEILKFEVGWNEWKTAIEKFRHRPSGTGANQYVDVGFRYLVTLMEVEMFMHTVQQDLSQKNYTKAVVDSAIILGINEGMKLVGHKLFKLFEPIDARLGKYIHETRKRYYRGID